MVFADIIVDISQEQLDRTFCYIVPETMLSSVRIGTVVEIPFGRGNHITKGYVIRLSSSSKIAIEKLKEIRSVITGDSQQTCEDRLIALAAWMRETYGSTMIQALRTVIPIKKKIKPKEKRSISLLLSEEETKEKLLFYIKKSQRARYRLLKALQEEPELPYDLVVEKLNISPLTIKAMEENQVIQIRRVTVYRNPVGKLDDARLRIPLNQMQQDIVDTIWNHPEDRVSLIHGVTGSGKTEVYMELIARFISQGKQAIVLIPEIALTYQTVMRFYRRFGDRISIIHSRLSPGERYDQFERAKNGDLDIMIGPRSALFTPFSNLGCIIIDEEHEASYKSESTPAYHARETAIQRAILDDARVILGSATPSVEAFYKARKGEYKLYTMDKRAKADRLPEVLVVDMREELRQGNRSIFSRMLYDKMQKTLQEKNQIMLFLNRRGYSGFLSCRMCGFVYKCPHCDVSLALHNNGRMVCHYCGYQIEKPHRCPECSSEYISAFGIGTQQIEELVKKTFPEARVLRMDLDTTKEKDGHEKILSAFSNQEADILIGTQMIVKGHDFPNVTMVGILAADISLHADDYKAGERTFQLLTQAAGRAGRGEKDGEVVIQTYDPDHFCIRMAAKQDYYGFYEEEILYRQLAGYPPARSMMTIYGSGADESYLQIAMEYLMKLMERIPEGKQIQIFGPVPDRIAKIQDIYRKVIYLKAMDEQVLGSVKSKLEKYIEVNEGYQSVHIQFDKNV